MPIEIKHALNKNLTEVSKERMAPPTVFQNWDEIPRPVSKSIPKRINKKEEQIVRQKEILLKDNLSVKFIEDQEEMVRRLEKQLEHERKARKELDYQFTDKMKELEKFKVLDQEIKAAKDHYSKQQIKESSPKISRSKSANKSMGPMVIKAPAHRPTTHQDLKSYYFQTEDAPKLKKVTSEELLSHIEIAKESLEEENIILDRNGGNIFEIPTRDSHKPLVMKKPEEWIKPKNMAQESQKYLQKEKQVTINPNPVTINSTPVFQRPESAPLAKNFEITEMRSKMDPLLNALSSTITRLNCSEKYGSHTGIGLISRVSAKYIAYYAEDLSDLILDDILIDITQELQEIDQKESQKNMSEFKAESEKFVDDLIKGFHEQTVELQEKYSKPKPEKRILVLEEEAEIVIEDVRRLWSIDIDEKVMKSINLYKREMQKYQDVYGGGSQGKLWEIYEIVGDDFVEEAFNDAVEDYLNVFDEYTDKIIGQEFL